MGNQQSMGNGSSRHLIRVKLLIIVHIRILLGRRQGRLVRLLLRPKYYDFDAQPLLKQRTHFILFFY